MLKDFALEAIATITLVMGAFLIGVLIILAVAVFLVCAGLWIVFIAPFVIVNYLGNLFDRVLP